MDITEKQKIVLLKIYGFMAAKSYPPTVRDVAQMMGFSSPKAAADHLVSLEKKGYLERASLARSIKLAKKAFGILSTEKSLPFSKTFPYSPEIYNIPILGRIAAGNPLLAEENIEEYVPVSNNLLGSYGADFALKVKGDSMTGDHILDGDLVMVKSQRTAENGDIVVALIDGEAVVKRFYKTKRQIELRSANPLYPSIKINFRYQDKDISKDMAEDAACRDKDFNILGRVVAIHRNI